MAKLTNCDACPLNKYKGRMDVKAFDRGRVIGVAKYREVPFKGNKKAQVVILGESPGGVEVLRGKPFVGESGFIVDTEFKKNQLDTRNFFFANVMRCMLLKNNLTPKEQKKAVACCFPAAEAAIQALRPKLVIAFGNIAMQALTKMSGITKKRGMFYPQEGFTVFPTYHPAYCLRDQQHFAIWNPDIATVSRYIKNNFHLPKQTGTEYREVQSIDFLLKQRDITVGLDSETQGVDVFDPNFVFISYSISDAQGKGYQIYLHREALPDEKPDFVIKWERGTGKQKRLEKVGVKRCERSQEKLKELKTLMERRDIKKLMFNMPFERRVFQSAGITAWEGVMLDSQLVAHALDPDNFTKAALDKVQQVFTPAQAGHKATAKQQFDKKDMLAATAKNKDAVTEYAAADADAHRTVGLCLKTKLCENRKLANYYAKLVHPVTNEVLYDMHQNGVMMDRTKLPEVKAQIARLLKEKTLECLRTVPKSVLLRHKEPGLRLTRKELVKDALFSRDGFGLQPNGYTKTGDVSTDRKLLARMRDDLEVGCPAYNFLSEYMDWGPYNKLYTTYLKGYEESIKADGLLHPQTSVINTATGRTGQSDPNLQNIPKRNPAIAAIIRSLLIARPGKIFVAKDYRQNELKWIAFRSRDPLMLRLYREGGDMHTTTGQAMARLAGEDWNKISKEQQKKYRQSAKGVNFGYCFAMFPAKWVQYVRDEYGYTATLEEATRFREMYFNTYKYLLPWHKKEIAFAQKNGFCQTNFGRIRLTPNIHSTEFMARSEDERTAINTVIQSPASDAGLLGCLEAKRAGLIDNKRVHLVLFIHDELIWEVDEGYAEDFSKEMDGYMTNLPTERFGFNFDVPLATDTKIGYDLGHMEELQ